MRYEVKVFSWRKLASIFSLCWITFRKAKQKSVQNSGFFLHSKCGINIPIHVSVLNLSPPHNTSPRSGCFL